MTDPVHGRSTTSVSPSTTSVAAKDAPTSVPKASGPSFLSRVFDTLGLPGAADEAERGSDLVASAGGDQPTFERTVAAKLGRLWEANARTHVAAALDVARPLTDRLYGPAIREGREAAREIAGAYGGVVATDLDSLHETAREVGDAWNSQPTIERKVAAAGYELWENGWQANLRHLRSVGDVGRKFVEGAAEIGLRNPVWAAQQAIFGAGARGAIEAGRSVVDTARGNVDRTVDQQVENVREVGGSVADAGRTYVDNYRELGREVSDVWNGDDTIERKVAKTGYEVVENGVQGAVRNQVAAANVVKEAGEAAVENVATGVRNTGNAIAGGFRAAGGFVSGLLGG